MTDEGANQHSQPRWWLRLLVLASVAAVSLLVITAVQVVHTASLQEVHPADAIVVFGAAEYSGRPSPVLRARLDHALDLFHRGVAPVVITTGGAAGDPSFSEGGVGRDYLMRHGVPERSLIAETQGRDTAESAMRVGVLVLYGVHSVESLFTIMGTGCETVQRQTTPDGKIEVVGTWSDGRKGVFREDKSFHGLAKGERGETAAGSFDGYQPLVVAIMKFLQTGMAPVQPEETIEIIAFMEAADESKQQGGKPVKIVVARAQKADRIQGNR